VRISDLAENNDWTRKELEEQLASMRAITVPVNVQIRGQQRIFALGEMKKILREARLIALGECGCRKKLKKCDRPLDVCITLDKSAEEEVAKGNSKKVSLVDALEALRRSHESGLVHIAYVLEGKKKPDLICSCCSCCCHSMSALIRFEMPNAVATSRYVAHDNPESCINCGKCVERCQFKARHMHNGQKTFNEERCFGCGLCLTTCPSRSISLLERQGTRAV
jgi:Pyruvate/2-oxoacid:ferredoxin oxidoreductase delta subunit